MSLKSKKILLDNVFSQFIRLRDTDENGYAKCISCGYTKYYDDLDNGHFINRKHMSLRYNETNCNAQCHNCNRFDESNFLGYLRGIKKKYGENIAEQLEVCKYQTMHFTEFELTELIKYYRAENKRLLKDKNFTINLK